VADEIVVVFHRAMGRHQVEVQHSAKLQLISEKKLSESGGVVEAL